MPTDTDTYRHRQPHAYRHRHIQTQTVTCLQTQTHTDTDSHMLTDTDTDRHRQSHDYRHRHIQTQTVTCSQTQTQTDTCKHMKLTVLHVDTAISYWRPSLSRHRSSHMEQSAAASLLCTITVCLPQLPDNAPLSMPIPLISKQVRRFLVSALNVQTQGAAAQLTKHKLQQ